MCDIVYDICVGSRRFFIPGLQSFCMIKVENIPSPAPQLKSRELKCRKKRKKGRGKKKRFTVSRSNNKKVNEYKRYTCFCFSSFYLNDQHKFSLSCSFLWVTLFISSKFKIYGAFALRNANQINKRMIHIVDDLLGEPKQNKEERITCI